MHRGKGRRGEVKKEGEEGQDQTKGQAVLEIWVYVNVRLLEQSRH
jgi:hypothetical protein